MIGFPLENKTYSYSAEFSNISSISEYVSKLLYIPGWISVFGYQKLKEKHPKNNNIKIELINVKSTKDEEEKIKIYLNNKADGFMYSILPFLKNTHQCSTAIEEILNFALPKDFKKTRSLKPSSIAKDILSSTKESGRFNGIIQSTWPYDKK